jgi:hypothetical protein
MIKHLPSIQSARWREGARLHPERARKRTVALQQLRQSRIEVSPHGGEFVV